MTTEEQAAFRKTAAEYLQSTLSARAPQDLTFEAEFNEAPLEGEGRTALFSFELEVAAGTRSADPEAAPQGSTTPAAGSPAPACPGRTLLKHYVAAGQTTPNYFPAYGFDPDQAYSLHIGTRFLLEMGIQKRPTEAIPPDTLPRLQSVLENFLRSATSTPPEPAAYFGCDEGEYAVYQMTVNGQPYFVLGGDCPPGFYALTHLPPQVALRLHLGQLVRREIKAPERGQ